MKASSAEHQSARVPQQAKQADEIEDCGSWIERCIWTERMLTALEEGVKGGKWFALIDKVYSKQNLRSAFHRVKGNRGSAGVDHVTIERFEKDLEENLERLHRSLREATYRPQSIRRVWIEKAGSREKRPLGIPTVRDRVVQTALRDVLEPIFERDFAPGSYGFRPGRGGKDALRQVDQLLRLGYSHVVDADLKGYFDSIPQGPLMDRIREKIADGRVLDLLESFLKQEILEGTGAWTPETGTPQGAVISPLLANVYLDPLDHRMEGLGFQMVRYADDFVILCRSRAEAEAALAEVRKWTVSAGLTLHPEKTHIVDATQAEGFEFLGYRFVQGKRWPRKRSIQKLKETIRSKTRRTSGCSLEAIIGDVNRTLRGWFEYFKHSERYPHVALDGWVRMRLRSLLRRRQGRRGVGRGFDHKRWPNAFFAAHGLFSLSAAYAAVRQSSRR